MMNNQHSLNTDLFSTIIRGEELLSHPVSPKGLEPASPNRFNKKKTTLPTSRYGKKGGDRTSGGGHVEGGSS